MTQLEKAREAIDTIDRQMAALFEQRMRAVEEVAQYKMEHHLPVLDASREQAVLDKNRRYIQDPAYEEGYLEFQKQVMTLSRQYQQAKLARDVVAFQGAEGAFSHMSCQRLFPTARLHAYGTFEEVIQAVCDKKARYGVIPFENTSSGLVGEVLDLLAAWPIAIHEVSDQPIDQCLLGVEGATLKDIEWVYSKDQALAQSKEFLHSLGAQAVPYPNTALAARYVAKCRDKRKAAIGARENADLYGLEVLSSHVQEDKDNTTRFLVISDTPGWQGDHFSLILSVRDEAGALNRALNTIARHHMNMDSIQSRPRKGFPFQYFFYIEVAGAPDAASIRHLMEDLKEDCEQVQFLGAYDRREKGEQS